MLMSHKIMNVFLFFFKWACWVQSLIHGLILFQAGYLPAEVVDIKLFEKPMIWNFFNVKNSWEITFRMGLVTRSFTAYSPSPIFICCCGSCLQCHCFDGLRFACCLLFFYFLTEKYFYKLVLNFLLTVANFFPTLILYKRKHAFCPLHAYKKSFFNCGWSFRRKLNTSLLEKF